MTVAEMALRDALADSRRTLQTARMYAERCREISVDGMRSPDTDGQPKGSGQSAGAARAISIDALRRMAAAAQQEAEQAQSRARRALRASRITGARLLFLESYYVLGLEMAASAEAADRSIWQCWRYMRELFGAPPERTWRERGLPGPEDSAE